MGIHQSMDGPKTVRLELFRSDIWHAMMTARKEVVGDRTQFELIVLLACRDKDIVSFSRNAI